MPYKRLAYFSFYTFYNILRFRIKKVGEFISSTTVYTLIILSA